MSANPIVVKIGGSLFDLTDLGSRLCAWLDDLQTRAVLLVPGGGATADAIRVLDRRHGLGEEAAHWLALRTLSVNASFLAELLAPVRAVLVDGPMAAPARWEAGEVPIVDAYQFALADEGRPGALPHSWTVTSDSIAARVAVVARAQRLVLLKSVTIPDGTSWAEAARQGWVDAFFPQAIGGDRKAMLEVSAINFRTKTPGWRATRPGHAP